MSSLFHCIEDYTGHLPEKYPTPEGKSDFMPSAREMELMGLIKPTDSRIEAYQKRTQRNEKQTEEK